MDKQVTTNDIAQILGISRGTVSKALNDKANVDKYTRRLVIKTATEMGYKRLDKEGYITRPDANTNTDTIVIMIRGARYGDTYWSFFIKGFEEEIINRKYRFTINVIDQEDEDSLILPEYFSNNPPAGIVTIGPFNKEYYLKIKSCGIPVVYVDTAPDVPDSGLLGDTVMICNREYVFEMATHLIKKGHKRFGFVRDYSLCRSFQDRWEGFCDALKLANLPICEDLIYGMKKNETISVDELIAWLSSIKNLPTCFVCANDLHALITKTALLEIGYSTPRDFAICGFDNDPSVSVLYPQLTTVESHVNYIGGRAMQELFWRMTNPDAPYELIKITSKIHYRNSTEGYLF